MNISLRNVTKGYFRNGDRVAVLKNASVEIASGTSTAIVGPSGSGKTTLLSLVGGLDDPDQGTILMDRFEISRMSEDERTAMRSRTMGIVFQKFHLIPTLTAVENVALPMEINELPDAEANALAALKAVGLEHRAQHLPSELSGGESQRVAIARAMIIHPKVLLADEPSGNLDSTTGNMVMDLLFSLCAANKTTLVLVTHNQAHAERCERILTLTDGCLVDR